MGKNHVIKYAAIAGIISVPMFIFLIALEVPKALTPSPKIATAYWLVYVLSTLAEIIFAYGFKIVGDKVNNRLLAVASYALIAYTGFAFLADLLFPSLQGPIYTIFLLLGAVIGVMFGTALLGVKKRFGNLATFAGIIAIALNTASALFALPVEQWREAILLPLAIILPILVIASYATQILLLFRAYKKLN